MDAKQAFQFWSERQQLLRQALRDANRHSEAIALFLQQHAMLHAAALAPGAPWSFADVAVAGLDDSQLRAIPRGHTQSIAWLLWHSARTEDAATSIVLCGAPQLLEAENWNARLGLTEVDIGTSMSDAEVDGISARVDLAALLDYRLAVGRRTREIVQAIPANILRQSVEPERIQRVKDTGVLVAEAYGVADYWGRHPKSNVLLMPATRHPMTHLHEALRIKERLMKTVVK